MLLTSGKKLQSLWLNPGCSLSDLYQRMTLNSWPCWVLGVQPSATLSGALELGLYEGKVGPVPSELYPMPTIWLRQSRRLFILSTRTQPFSSIIRRQTMIASKQLTNPQPQRGLPGLKLSGMYILLVNCLMLFWTEKLALEEGLSAPPISEPSMIMSSVLQGSLSKDIS